MRGGSIIGRVEEYKTVMKSETDFQFHHRKPLSLPLRTPSLILLSHETFLRS